MAKLVPLRGVEDVAELVPLRGVEDVTELVPLRGVEGVAKLVPLRGVEGVDGIVPLTGLEGIVSLREDVETGIKGGTLENSSATERSLGVADDVGSLRAKL